MKLALMVLLYGVLLFTLIPAKKAECAWCPSYTCYGAGSCGYGCSCVTMGGEMGGKCISVEHVEE